MYTGAHLLHSLGDAGRVAGLGHPRALQAVDQAALAHVGLPHHACSACNSNLGTQLSPSHSWSGPALCVLHITRQDCFLLTQMQRAPHLPAYDMRYTCEHA